MFDPQMVPGSQQIPFKQEMFGPVATSSTHLFVGRTGRARLTFLGIQAIHIAILLLFGNEVSPILLGASAIVSLLVYGWLLKSELTAVKTAISPFILYLCTAMLVVGASPLWAAAVYYEGFHDVFMFGRFDATNSLMQGHKILLLGDWLFIAGYSLLASRVSAAEPIPPIRRTAFITNAALFLIVLGWSLEIGVHLGIDPSGLGNWYKTFAKFSGPAGLLMLLYVRRHSVGTERHLYLSLILACFSVEIVLALRSYMKQEAIMVLLPLVIALFSQVTKIGSDGRSRLRWSVLMIASVVLIFVALILFPFNEMRRADSWYGKERIENPDTVPYLIEAAEGSVPGTSSFARLHQFPDGGFWSFFERHAYLRSCGWSYQYVLQNGHTRGEFLRDGLVALIPRAVWPDKPMIAAGRKIAVMLGQARDIESATTSTDAGSMAGALYLNYGLLSLIIGMFVNGALLFLVWNWIATDILINPFAALTAMMLYVAAGRYFASAADGNIAFYITIFVLYLPLVLITRRPVRGREGAGPVTARMPV
jgi:hypothetical protein